MGLFLKFGATPLQATVDQLAVLFLEMRTSLAMKKEQTRTELKVS